jgi:hypothetical protein
MDGLNAYIPRVAHAADEAPIEMAETIAAEWRSRAHVITGAYKASIYTQTHTESGYSGAVSGYQARRTSPPPLPEPPRPARKGAASVQSVAPYAVHEELGSRARAPHPAFTPAVELARRQFPELVKRRLQP